MKSILVSRTVISLIAAAIAMTAIAGNDGIVLKAKPKVGDVREFKITATYDSPQGDIKYSENRVTKVKDVKADGSFVTETSNSNVTVDVGGQTMNPPDSVSTTEFTPNGRATKITAEQAAEAASYRIVHLSSFEAPDGAVNPGDEIKYTIPADKTLGTPAMNATYKVVGPEKVKDWDTIKLTYKNEETEGETKSSMTGTLWLSAADGMMVKSDGKWIDVQPQGVPFALTGKYLVERTK